MDIDIEYIWLSSHTHTHIQALIHLPIYDIEVVPPYICRMPAMTSVSGLCKKEMEKLTNEHIYWSPFSEI